MIEKGESAERTPVYYQTAASYGTPDYGTTYVEINLTAQHLFFYQDGKLMMESDFVSGNSAKGYDTPAGVYSITYKQRDATLTGENYQTPVSYWMPFNGGVGIHDAKWRASFGGTLYQGNGSHGCVNTPWDQAGIIFDNIEIGTPIVVYKSSINQGTGSVAISQPAETRVINEQGVEVTPESSAADTTTGTTTDTLSDPTSYTAIDGQ